MDSWCKQIKIGTKAISGGAARNVRIARSGGMDAILLEIVSDALKRANEAAWSGKRAKIHQLSVA